MEEMRSSRSNQYIEAARSALRTNQARAAIIRLKDLLVAEPNNAEAFELLGIAHTMVGQYADARTSLERSLAFDPRRATAHYNYALLMSKLNELDLATEANQTALYLAPTHKGAQALQRELAQKIRFRAFTSDQGFRTISKDQAPRVGSRFSNLSCVSCGAMNFPTARSCARCGTFLPGSTAVAVME